MISVIVITYLFIQEGAANLRILDHLMCPISHDIFVDPVTTVLGYTYERASIENWFKTHQTDPLKMEKISSKDLVPNRAIKSAVEEFNNSKLKMSST